MTIKQSDASIKNDEFKRLEYKVEQILDMSILKETPDILEKIQDILRDVKNVNFNNLNPILLEGNIVSSERVKELIIKATGFTKWSLDEDEILEQDEINEYKNEYSIDFKESEIHCYRFCRSTNHRNSVSMITVTVLPGVFKVEIDTGRANYELDGLLNEKELVSDIEAEYN